MQHGAGGGLDGLFFSGTDGTGSDPTLWWCFGAASWRKQLAAWNCGSRSRITAGSARASGRRSRLDRAGRSSRAEFIRAIARARPAVLKYDQCVPDHRVTEDTERQGDKETGRQGDEETRRQDGARRLEMDLSPHLPVSLSSFTSVSSVTL